MKNKLAALFSAILIGLLLLTACKSGKRQSLSIPFMLVQLGLTETAYNYSNIVIGNYADRSFTITNTGNKDGLQVTGFTSSDSAFTVLTNEDSTDTKETCTTQSLAAGASCTFTVHFKPTEQKEYNNANIAIASNNILPSSVAVSGEGCRLNVWMNNANFTNCSDGVVTVDVTATNSAGAVDLDSFNLSRIDAPWPWPTVPLTISYVTPRYNDDPISVVLALDFSSSLTSNIDTIRSSAKYFINNLNDNNEAAIYSFKINIINYPSSSFESISTGKSNLTSFIDTTPPLPEGTALFDALYDSITRAASGSKTKKAVVVLSDGDDRDSSNHTMAQVIAYAKSLNIPIFTIFYVDSDFANLAKPQYMHQIAVETGGQDYYTDTTTTTMESIFGQIRNIMGSKYVVHFSTGSVCTGSFSFKVKAVSGTDYGIDTRTFIVP
ncbi:MAG: VWA domain-containing protein [Spirochaetes bacterium]|nr:VWA domain-containing protein [Spirochaetota bacterium]